MSFLINNSAIDLPDIVPGSFSLAEKISVTTTLSADLNASEKSFKKAMAREYV